MIRQLGPLAHNVYLHRCALVTCSRISQAYYSTTPPPSNTKQQKGPPPKAPSAASPKNPPTPSQKSDQGKSKSSPSLSPSPSSSPSPSPKASTPKPTTSKPKPSSAHLPFPHQAWAYENVHPVYEFSKLQEDRTIGVADLISHVTKNPFKSDYFKDTVKVNDVAKAVEKLKDKKFSFYGVFDGHQGKFAAEYVKERLPYEIVTSPEFAAGNYEGALKSAFLATHKALLASEGYRPEEPKYDFTSGTTASVALVTPTTTYFAQTGDSPILVKKLKEKAPSVLFKQPNTSDDVERLRASNMFLMVNLAPVSDPKDREEFWEEITKKGKDLQFGPSNINVLSTLGDSLYEPENLNSFLSAVEEWLKKGEYSKPRGYEKAGGAREVDKLYPLFLKHVKGSEKWKEAKKHVAVGKDREHTGWVTNGLIEGSFKLPAKIKHSPIRREPQVASVPNDQITYINLATDGVLLKEFNEDHRAMRDLDRMILEHAGVTRTRMGINFHDWFFGRFGDDISSVIVDFRNK